MNSPSNERAPLPSKETLQEANRLAEVLNLKIKSGAASNKELSIAIDTAALSILANKTIPHHEKVRLASYVRCLIRYGAICDYIAEILDAVEKKEKGKQDAPNFFELVTLKLAEQAQLSRVEYHKKVLDETARLVHLYPEAEKDELR